MTSETKAALSLIATRLRDRAAHVARRGFYDSDEESALQKAKAEAIEEVASVIEWTVYDS